VQRRGNVWLVQHAFPCTPCQLEGCERRLESYSACLDALPVAQVMQAVDEALSARVQSHAT
jgi:heptosyltransferase-3